MVFILKNLAISYSLLHRHEEQLAHAQRALPLEEKLLGPDHPELVETLAVLAQAHEKLGEPARALPLLERALAITASRPLTDAYSIGRGPRVHLQGQLADTLWSMKRDRKRARALVASALEMARGGGDDEAKDVTKLQNGCPSTRCESHARPQGDGETHERQEFTGSLAPRRGRDGRGSRGGQRPPAAVRRREAVVADAAAALGLVHTARRAPRAGEERAANAPRGDARRGPLPGVRVQGAIARLGRGAARPPWSRHRGRAAQPQRAPDQREELGQVVWEKLFVGRPGLRRRSATTLVAAPSAAGCAWPPCGLPSTRSSSEGTRGSPAWVRSRRPRRPQRRIPSSPSSSRITASRSFRP